MERDGPARQAEGKLKVRGLKCGGHGFTKTPLHINMRVCGQHRSSVHTLLISLCRTSLTVSDCRSSMFRSKLVCSAVRTKEVEAGAHLYGVHGPEWLRDIIIRYDVIARLRLKETANVRTGRF